MHITLHHIILIALVSPIFQAIPAPTAEACDLECLEDIQIVCLPGPQCVGTPGSDCDWTDLVCPYPARVNCNDAGRWGVLGRFNQGTGGVLVEATCNGGTVASCETWTRSEWCNSGLRHNGRGGVGCFYTIFDPNDNLPGPSEVEAICYDPIVPNVVLPALPVGTDYDAKSLAIHRNEGLGVWYPRQADLP